MAPNKRLAIIWTTANPIHICIYAALGENELTREGYTVYSNTHVYICTRRSDMYTYMCVCTYVWIRKLLVCGLFYVICEMYITRHALTFMWNYTTHLLAKLLSSHCHHKLWLSKMYPSSVNYANGTKYQCTISSNCYALRGNEFKYLVSGICLWIKMWDNPVWIWKKCISVSINK